MPIDLATLAASFVSVLIALALYRLRVQAWLSVAVGGLGPGLLILGWFLCLESREPVGPYFAVVGLVYGGAALVFGLASAGVAVLIAREMGDQGTEADG
ncbi:MAG TPA: hypothetical protein VFZ91_16825 [Allosphingosinicella sp.]